MKEYGTAVTYIAGTRPGTGRRLRKKGEKGMKEFMKRLKTGFKGTSRSNRKLATLLAMIVVIGVCVVPVFATTTPTLSINFDIQQMFTWAQTIINAMLPVVYIIMGVALGFLIIRAFKAAFN